MPRDDLNERLALVRVAKDVFLTDWYMRAVESLVEEGDRELLHRIREETKDERDQALDLMRRWAAEEGASATSRIRMLATSMERDFLSALMEIKQASGQVFHEAALVAPSKYREDLHRLADIDLRHALEVRDILLRMLREKTKALEEERRVGARET